MLNKAQIWVETAVYTLIGLVIIAILLAIVTPQIQNIKDKSIVEQTMNSLERLNEKILEIEQAPGNIRIVDFKIMKGKIILNSEEDSVDYVLENTKLRISEPGKEIKEGNLILKTEEYGSRYRISLSLRYDNLDLTFEESNSDKILQQGTQPHRIKIENIGYSGIGEPINIDFGVL